MIQLSRPGLPAALLSAVLLAACARGSADPAPSLAPPASTVNADINLFERRLDEDPQSAADRSRLAGLYLRRARQTGNYADVERGLAQAESSLVLREAHNSATYSVIAAARLAGHDFTGALDAARRVVESEPWNPAYRALLAEVYLELGKYGDAAAIFRTLEGGSDDLSVAPRLVRWYEVTGHLARALALSRHAARLAGEAVMIDPEQKAWFHLRAGEIAAKSWALEVAEGEFAAGLAANPGDYRILAARARLRASRGEWRAAIADAEESIAVHLEPGTLGLLRDAWLALGDSAQSASYGAAMSASALVQPGPIHRAWGLNLVDHGEELAEVRRRVMEEQRTRRDVYGYDLLAWVLHAMGKPNDAWAAAKVAIGQGTEDAELIYRAGVVAAGAGAGGESDSLLRRALAVRGLLPLETVRELQSRFGVQ